MPRSTLWDVAYAIAEYRADRSTVGMLRRVVGDTLWRDEGRLPSGDAFTLWMACEL